MPRPGRWEYIYEENVKHEQLNRYGEEGWELAAISHGGGWGTVGIDTWVYIFKRPKYAEER